MIACNVYVEVWPVRAVIIKSNPFISCTYGLLGPVQTGGGHKHVIASAYVFGIYAYT